MTIQEMGPEEATRSGRPTGDVPLSGPSLVRLIDREPDEWTVDDLLDIVETRKLKLVSLMHVGGDGCLKTLDFPVNDLIRLRQVLLFGERADGSSLFPSLGRRSKGSDIILRARPPTAFIDPFSVCPTLVVLCGHSCPDGSALPESPDTILRRAYERVRIETGIDLWALGEVEFFLGKRVEHCDFHGASDRGYQSTSPFVFGEGLRRQALAVLADLNIPAKYAHSEVGYIETEEPDPYIWEQHEIELNLQPLPKAADAVLVTQWVVRNLAKQAGCDASFEPVVLEGHAGSGLHFHFSPVVKGAHQRHTNADGALVDSAKWLIGGLVRCADALMAFGNRAPSSFTRLAQAKEAPSTVTWGHSDRKALVRLPIVAGDEQGQSVAPETVEFRLPDASAHPHLLLAAIAQVMLAARSFEDLNELLEMSSSQGQDAARALRLPLERDGVILGLENHREFLEEAGVFPRHFISEAVDVLRGPCVGTSPAGGTR